MSSNRPSSTRPRRNRVRAAASRWAGAALARPDDVVMDVDGRIRTLADITVSTTARAGSLGIFPR